MNTMREAVKKGGEVLDRYNPGWHNKIDLSSLDLESPCRCILGQLYGHWVEGVRLLTVFNCSNGVYLIDLSRENGFVLSTIFYPSCHTSQEDGYRELTDLWVQEIQSRCNEDKKNHPQPTPEPDKKDERELVPA